MLFPTVYMLLSLCAIMVGALVVARLAQERQEQNMVRLHRLAALDRRRVSTRTVIRALQELDDHPELMRILNHSLKNDLQRIQGLDPRRADLETEIRQVHSAMNSFGEEARAERGDKSGDAQEQRRVRLDRRTSLSSEREIQITKGYISEAVEIVRRMYQLRHVRADQMENVIRYLGQLNVLVGVNSHLNIGDLALQHGDKIKALGCYRRAEMALQRGPVVGRERLERMEHIEAKKQQLLALSKSEKGLLLMASGD